MKTTWVLAVVDTEGRLVRVEVRQVEGSMPITVDGHIDRTCLPVWPKRKELTQ